MKKITLSLLTAGLVLALVFGVNAGVAQAADPPATATLTPTNTTAPTVTPTYTVTPVSTNTSVPTAISLPTELPTDVPVVNTNTPVPGGRPIVVLSDYKITSGSIVVGQSVEVSMTLKNIGNTQANNLRLVFVNGEYFIPSNNGGVQALQSLGAGSSTTITQRFIAANQVAWTSSATQAITLTYNDALGQEFNESFTLNFMVDNTQRYQPTSTPTLSPAPKLVVKNYQTDLDPIQAGNIFNLILDIENQGGAEARQVMLVIGGATVPTGEQGSQTQGLDAGSGDLSKFAPLGSSNLHNLGNISAGAVFSHTQQLVVNVSTEPGVYPLKLSFVYDDSSGKRYMDNQFITLLVYALPNVSVSYYRDFGQAFIGQETMLPIQVTNLGRKTIVLGDINVSVDGAEVFGGSSTVGSLESGGYFTIDPRVIPAVEGENQVMVEIRYNDDFNQERVITQILNLEVSQMEMPMPMPGEEMYPPNGNGEKPNGPISQSEPETVGQKIGRFFKGLFGLGSGRASA
jgi:hypothetical protein